MTLRKLFRPTWPQAFTLALIAAGATGYAAVLRYQAIEVAAVSLACDAGGTGWLCTGRKIALAFSQSGAFGGIALASAALNMIRPSVVLVAIGLLTAAFGLVLYNTATSAVAVALIALSLARPAPEPE